MPAERSVALAGSLARLLPGLLAALLAAACTLPATWRETAAERADDAPARFVADLPDLGPAPELHDGAWLNSARPLSLAGLRGKVVLLEMWTFG